MEDRSRKAVVNEDGKTFSVYHEGREYWVGPSRYSQNEWKAMKVESEDFGFGKTIWDAIANVE
jgi:hypothetical protein